jgi:hypothetical protein
MPRPLRVALATSALLLGTASAVYGAKEPQKPVLVPPEVAVTLSTGSAGPSGAWTIQVSNVGAVPLRLDADARLLRLEVSPLPSASASASASAKPGAKKLPAPKAPPPTICELPASMRAEGRPLVLQPGQRWIEVFDPRLFCLDATSKLDAGARVVATLGWPAGKTLTPPFVIEPVVSASASASASGSPSAATSSAPRVASAKELAAPAIEIPPRAPASASASGSASAKPPAPAPALIARGGAARSIYAGKDAEVTVVVSNGSASAQTIYARPSGIGVLVRGPRGERTQCDPGLMSAPIVDFIVQIGAGGAWTGATRLDALCPPGTFDRPGLYELWPTLRAPAIPDRPNAFAGTLRAASPQLLRVETGKLPYQDALPIAAPTASSVASSSSASSSSGKRPSKP